MLSSCAETLGVTVKITQENSILLEMELFDSEVNRVDRDQGQSEQDHQEHQVLGVYQHGGADKQ